jgi:hypothetical protein
MTHCFPLVTKPPTRFYQVCVLFLLQVPNQNRPERLLYSKQTFGLMILIPVPRWPLGVTVGLPEGPHHNCNTFLLTLGSSKIDHSEAYDKLTSELNSINRNDIWLHLYLQQQKMGITAHVRPYCFLQDTPETTDCNQTASWKSPHTILSSFIVDINPLQTKLPSCRVCLSKRKLGLFTTGHRTMGESCCLNWYPPVTVPITKDQLISSCTEAHSIVTNDPQDVPKLARDMLRQNGLSPKLVQKIIHAGAHSQPFPALPPLWFMDSFDICDLIEVFNLLLFLGIAKTLLKDILYPWISCRRQWKDFVSLTEHPWSVLTWLRLDWLKLLPMAPNSKSNAHYNGWTRGHYISCIFVFAPDGTIPIAALNSPGSLHDSTVAFYGGVYDSLEYLHEEYGVRIVVDSSFKIGSGSFLLKLAQTGTDVNVPAGRVIEAELENRDATLIR